MREKDMQQKEETRYLACKPHSFTTLRQANAQAVAHALSSSNIINEMNPAKRTEMPVEDARVALDDLAIAGRYCYEVQGVTRIAQRVNAGKATA